MVCKELSLSARSLGIQRGGTKTSASKGSDLGLVGKQSQYRRSSDRGTTSMLGKCVAILTGFLERFLEKVGFYLNFKTHCISKIGIIERNDLGNERGELAQFSGR